MQALYYDRDGRQVSEQRRQELGRQPGYSRIGYTDGARHGLQVTVVTFWSGIADHGPDGPLLFCTCAGIRDPDTRRTAYQRVWGWPDIAADCAGHQAVTAWTDQVAAFLAGHASQLPTPGPPCPACPRRPTVRESSKRFSTPLPGPDSRPLCVRGHRNMTVYSDPR